MTVQALAWQCGTVLSQHKALQDSAGYADSDLSLGDTKKTEIN